MLTKTLWIARVSDADRLFDVTKAIGAGTIAIRASAQLTPGLIQKFHDAEIKVFGWYYAAVQDNNDPHKPVEVIKHARHVATNLVPAGLDGYIVDPEGSGDAVTNWDKVGLGPLAKQWCEIVKKAVRTSQRFSFGLTSHYLARQTYAHLPWTDFLAYCDALYPQSYWRMVDETGAIKPIGTGPAANLAASVAAYKQLPWSLKACLEHGQQYRP